MAISDSASSLAGPSAAYRNPVYGQYFADPFVLQAEGAYFAFGTGKGTEEAFAFQVLRSADLTTWTALGSALLVPPELAGRDFWAPEVVPHEGEFHMYYSAGIGDVGHHIRLAVSSQPSGPYVDQGPVQGIESPFAIDAHVYAHSDGERYLYFAADRLEGERPGTCLYVDRLIAPGRVAGRPVLVAHATADWQRFEASRPMYGGVYDWHTLEGPCAVFRQGRVYVLYSGGNWQNDTYGVDFVFADHPMGPYVNETRDRPRCLRTLPGEVLGPGHNSLTVAPDGKTDVIVYHAWDPDKTGRFMRIDPLDWTEAGPVARGPSTDPRQLPA